MKPVRIKGDEAPDNEESLSQAGNSSDEVFDPEWEPVMAQLPGLVFDPSGLVLQPAGDDGEPLILGQHPVELSQSGIMAMNSAHFGAGPRLQQAFGQIAAVFGAQVAAEICEKYLPASGNCASTQLSINNRGCVVEEWIQHLRETGAWILAQGNA